jgi:hypothetical protein
MTKKKVYIVKSSTDGNLGVYTTIAKAYQEAMNYFSHHGNLSINNEYKCTLKNIKDFSSENIYSDINIYSDNTSAYCRIEQFFLNI